MRRINALPVTAEIRSFDIARPWRVAEVGALYWLEAMNLAKFLQAKIASVKMLNEETSRALLDKIDQEKLDKASSDVEAAREDVLRGTISKLDAPMLILRSIETKLVKRLGGDVGF